MDKYSAILALFSLFTIKFGILCVLKKIHHLEELRISREEGLKKWLFESLYSINNKVVLPTEAGKEISNEPGGVYVPSKDPMAIFTGKHEDYYESE